MTLIGRRIRVSEDFYDWVDAHSREEETLGQTLRRLTRGPDPDELAGLLSTAEAERAKAAVENLRGRSSDRFGQN
jgi:hypothetical protein